MELAGVPLAILLTLFGLAVGSFLNVVISRMPHDESISNPPSHCPECNTPIKLYDNIPVVSYIVLRGRCRSCGVEFGLAYLLVEVANAVLWVLAGMRFGPSWALIPMLVLFSTLLAQSVIDLETYRLLDKITFPILGVSVALIGIVSVIEGEPGRIVPALVGAFAYFVALFVPSFVTRGKGMGLGDVKLAPLMGLYLGWINPMLVLFSLILACLLGIVVGLGVWLVRRKSEAYPFGPWLALGCIGTLLGSSWILERWFLGTAAWLA